LYLKSLAIRGFKSFADKTTLKFEPGITVIVGPNGSGKSNITDAVLWVLGEQSARSLRGAAMEDVIFTGSSTRSPLGIAEVSLCLDNSDGHLPIEYSEVVVTRKMSRSGESDYFINGSSCRLLDVQDILSDTGLGRQTHSIISQGKIEEILNSKPEDKRFLIEDAAGILKHRKRKERALGKLVAMDRNLTRIRDILHEVERQRQPLKKQAMQAEKSLKLNRQLKDTEIGLAVVELKEFQNFWEKALKQVNYLNNELSSLKKKSTKKQYEMNETQSNIEAKGDYVGDIGEHRRRLKGIIERLNSGLLLLEEKGKHLIEKLSDLRMQIYKAERQISNKSDELDEVKLKILKYQGAIDELLDKISKTQKNEESIQKKIKRTDESLKDLKENRNKKFKQLEIDESEVKNLSTCLHTTEAEIKYIEEKISSLEKEKNALARLLTEKGEEKTLIESTMSKLMDFFNKKRDEISKKLAELDELTAQVNESEGKIFGIKTKISALEEVEKKLTGYPESVVWLTFEKKIPGLVGVAGDLIEVKKGYEKAIESVLSEHVYSVIARDIETTVKIVDMLNESSQDLTSIIPLVGLKTKFDNLPKDSGATLATDVVMADAEIEAAIKSLLGNVLIVKTLDDALAMANKDVGNRVFVTLNGEVILPQGIIKGGNLGSANPLSRKRELAKLKKDEKTLNVNFEKMGDKIQKLRLVLKSLNKEKDSLEEKIRVTQIEKQNIVSDLSYSKKNETEKINEIRRFSIQAELLKKKVDLKKEKIKKLDGISSLLKKEIASINSSIAKAEDEKQEWLTKRNKLIGEKAKLEAENESLLGQLEFVKKQHDTILAEVNEFDLTLKSEHQTVEALENLRARIQPLHELFSTLYNKAENWDEKLLSLTTDEKTDTKKLREKYKFLQTEITELAEKIDIIQDEIKEIEVNRAQLQIKVRELTEKIINEFDVPIEKALKTYSNEGPKEEYEEKIKKIKAKLVNLGPVNSIAVEEHLVLEKRYKFLNDQIVDLKMSRKTLEKIIRIIEQKMKDRFLETFNEINLHFQNIFSYLFPGGKAQLILMDEDNLLTTGVEIEAHPHGKRLQRMTLLSGGEKSLVALTLLFAIYQISPSPFYILDEVEPALDDANLQRFIMLLKKEKDGTQFIIVTHQRRTMEIADCLYGVTMQAEGVSKLVSQKMSDLDETNQISQAGR